MSHQKRRYRYAVVLDFEATCDDRQPPRPQEIIEFPSVLMSLETFETVDEFSTFVGPHHHPKLTEFCTELTSITQQQVEGAAPFAKVFADHQDWLESHGLDAGNALLVTCGDWDLKTMLPAQCAVAVPVVEQLPEIYSRWHNIKRAFCAVRKKRRAPGMAGMLRAFGLPLEGRHHRGIDDCRNIARLLAELLRQGARLGVTTELDVSKYPPIRLQLRLGERVEPARLEQRSLPALHDLAESIFRRKFFEIRRANGRSLLEDDDLRDLLPGEELELRVDGI